MKLYFILSHLNAIILAIWMIFLIIIAVRYFCTAYLRNISFFKLLMIATALSIFYGLFVSWGQYYVWANGSEVTKTLLNSPLPKQVPFWQWARPLFENHFGYFLFYILSRFWLNIIISFLISGALYFIFRAWKFYRGGFSEQGPILLLVLMLICGYPGVLVFIPLGFIFAIFLFGFYYFKGGKENNIVNIEPAFIVAAFFTLFFARIILNVL